MSFAPPHSNTLPRSQYSCKTVTLCALGLKCRYLNHLKYYTHTVIRRLTSLNLNKVDNFSIYIKIMYDWLLTCVFNLCLDVCNVPVDVGPCLQHLSKWYFDPASRSCQEFSYGGCDGSSNRFSSLPECESVCLHREELIPENNGSMSYLGM